MQEYHRIRETRNAANLADPLHDPITASTPLKCPDHPEVKLFLKITVCQSYVGINGKYRQYPKPPRALYRTSYVCPKCDDLLRIEPPRRMHNARS